MRRKMKKVLIVLLCLLMFVSSTVGLTMMIVNTTLDTSGKLGLSIADYEYGERIYDSVCEALEKKMALVAISCEDVSDILAEDFVRKTAPEAAVILARRLLGVDTQEWRCESEELLVRIEEKLNNYAAENGIEYEEGSAEKVYEMICDTVSAELNVVPQSYVDKVSPMFVKIKSLCELWPIPIAVFVLACVGVVVLGRRHIKRTVYDLMVPAYASAFTVFSVAAVMCGKDYLAKTVLGNSILQYYIRGMYNAIFSELRTISGIFIIVYLIVTAIVIIAIVTDQNKKHKKKHHHHHSHHHSENKNPDKSKPVEPAYDNDATAPADWPSEISSDGSESI